jgi:TonB-linked SusC/RagA family outer membrane protein
MSFKRKTLLVMRLTTFLLITGCLAVQASGFAQKVTLSARNASMESVFTDIKQQTGFFFMYDSDLLKKSGNVSINIQNGELSEALEQLTAGKPLSYKIIDKTVIISEVKVRSGNQQMLVKGTVRSKERSGSPLPLPGVVVTIKNSKRAVSTNGDGAYSIQVPADAVLIFSMVGYGTKEIAVGGKTIVDVVMEETVNDLNEVIVTAYGTTERKENQIGSAFTVTAEDLQRKPVARIDQMLEGIVPGLQYEVQDGGNTSSMRQRYQTRIRGEGSFSASSDPLWVLDGVPLNTGNETNMILGVNTSISPLTYLDPNDIESIVVLKDATATSIYGADGSNGVILITTKKGIAGKQSISYGFRTGLNIIGNNHLQVLDADQYRELYRESYLNNTALDPTKMPDLGTTNTDWYDVLFRTGITTQHNLALRGGNKTKYYIGGSYYNERMIEISNRVQRLAGRINLDRSFGKSVDAFLRIGGSYNTNYIFNPGNSYYINRPVDSPFNPDGTPVLAFYNKLNEAKNNDDQQKTYYLQGSAGGTIKILPGLDFTSTNGIDFSSIREHIYSSMFAWSYRGDGQALFGKSRTVNWNSQQRLNYNKTINAHDFSALIGAEARSDERRSSSRTGTGFEDDFIRNPSLAERIVDTWGGSEKTGISYYGQGRYTLANKYSVLGSFRRDANSDFGSDVRWATFSSVGASWTISNEDFWKIKAIDFAKLKMSYGTNGNSRIGSYKSKGVYRFTDGYQYGGEQGAVMVTGENPVLSWETTKIVNAGLSIGLFRRISMEIDVYQRTTNGMLDEVDVSRTTGFTGITRNIGSVRNRGIEMNLITQNIKSDNFDWTTNFNISHNQNTIMELFNGNSEILNTRIREVGKDANTWYLIRWAGVDPRDGAPMWYDARGNITREFNLANRVTAGSSTPDFFGGMTNKISYKALSLSALLIYNVGGYAFSSLQRDSESDGRNLAANNQSTNQLDRWREPGDISNVPKSILGENANAGRNSTRFLHDKTNLRLQNISLNYNLPISLISKISLNNANIYLQADNVGFWTPYNTPSNRNDFKNSFDPYPRPVVVSFGINVGL